MREEEEVELVALLPVVRLVKVQQTCGRLCFALIAGIDHEVAVAAAERLFAGLNVEADAGAISGRPATPFVGGDVRSSPDWAALPAVVAAGKSEASDAMCLVLVVGCVTSAWLERRHV